MRRADGAGQAGNRRRSAGSRRPRVRIGAYPIGVDVDAIAQRSRRGDRRRAVQRMTASLLGRKLIIGVDRLDYSKGLTERFAAFEHFLETLSGQSGQGDVPADRAAQPRGRAGVRRDPPRARAERRAPQRPLRGSGLDADPLSQSQLLARDDDGFSARCAGGAGHAGARWHESGREGVRRRAGSGGSGRADHLADGRRGARADGRAAGESVRQARHGARAADGAAHAARGAARSGISRCSKPCERNDIHHWYSRFLRDLTGERWARLQPRNRRRSTQRDWRDAVDA